MPISLLILTSALANGGEQPSCADICTEGGHEPGLCEEICALVSPAPATPAPDFWDGRAHPRAIWDPTHLGEPRLSPDGRRVAYIRRIADWEAGSKRSELWLAEVDGSADRAWTTEGASASNPRWSPDGRRLAFLSDRLEGGNQVFVMPSDGGEARALTHLDGGLGRFEWMPDGRRVAVVQRCEASAEEKAAEEAGIEAYRYDHTGRNDRLGIFEPDSGDLTWVTECDRHVVDFAFAGEDLLALHSAEGPGLYHTMLQSSLEVLRLGRGVVWRWPGVDFDGHSVDGLAWNPAGTRLAFQTYEQTLSLANALVVVDPLKDRAVTVSDPAADTLGGFTWAGDDALLFVSVLGTTGQVYRVGADGRGRVAMTDEVGLFGSLHAAGGRWVGRLSTRTNPGDLWVGKDRRAGALQRLTEANPTLAERLPTGEAQVVRWTSDDGTEIEGVLTLPPAGEAPYPLMLWPHGGPDACVTLSWRRWASFFAANGWAVFEPNFRGSTGYGRAFYQANRGALGQVDLEDSLSGVRALVDRGMADPDRLVVGGISYGGSMGGHILAATDMFDAIVVVAGVSDAISNYGLSDVNHGVAAQWEFMGDPVHQPETFVRASAIYNLEVATTPTLIMHGEEDARVDVAQAKELYRALVAKGTETELVIYPHEGHGVGRTPAHLEDHLRRWLRWYEDHQGVPAEE